MNTLYQLILALFISIPLYYILDTFSKKKFEEPRTSLNKWITLGVVFVVSYVFIYFMNNAFGGMSGGTMEEQVTALKQNYEVQMIKNITENVRTGFPPF
jgi:predicted PurR-regulated permease PerM